MSSNADQVVITGAGLITPLGLSRDETWRAVLQGRCGMGPISAMESPLPAGADGGEAPALPADFAPDLPREARYLRHTILQAIEDAGGRDALGYPPHRCGILLGTTLHGMRAGGRFFRSQDPAALKDFLAGAVLHNAAHDLNFTGCAATTCSACSSSLGSIALAMTLLQNGELDLVLAGGYDTISEYVYGGFNSLRLVAQGPLRPFTRDRQGMKLAEGYGILVLERAADASKRGARVLAAILGYGESSDAHHLTQPHPHGEGAARAMRGALECAGIEPNAIGLIAAHATGTTDNDAGEFAALSRVFGDSLPLAPVVAFKSHLGHTLGGAGAVELILSAMALRDQIVPACANVNAEDVEFPALNLTTGSSRRAPIRATLNTSLGFGGANTCMVLGPAPIASAPALIRTSPREVFITGVGVVFPGMIGNDAFLRRLNDRDAAPVTRDTGAIPDADILSLLNARRIRRMSDYVKLSLAATMLCLRDAGIADLPAFAESCSAVLGTTHGATNYCETYYRQIVTEGIGSANPLLFAEGVPNAAAAHLSLMLCLKGSCQTIIGTRTAGLDALRVAFGRIASGTWDRALVGSAEEYSPVINAAYRRQHLYRPEDDAPGPGFVTGSGAVMFLLESRRSLETRGGKTIGRILAAAGGQRGTRRSARRMRQLLDQIGNSPLVLTSANNTWIDRIESAGVRAGTAKIQSIYGTIAECFSVLPMAAIAARLLIQNTNEASSFSALASDYAGAVSGIAIEGGKFSKSPT